MLLSHTELLDLVDQGVITNVLPENVNGATIDVRLGQDFLYETRGRGVGLKELDLAGRDPLTVEKRTFAYGAKPFLDPGEFVLAHTMEVFHLPMNISAEFVLKSSMARSGLNQLTAQFCHAGWRNSVLTLELTNVTRFHRLLFTVGMEIGQMKFYKHTPVPEYAAQDLRGKGHFNDAIAKQ